MINHVIDQLNNYWNVIKLNNQVIYYIEIAR